MSSSVAYDHAPSQASPRTNVQRAIDLYRPPTKGEAPRAEDFVFVEVAVGGADRRGEIKRVGEWEAPDRNDVLMSAFRYGADILAYVQANRTSSGKPSVSQYPGSVWTDRVLFDFDREDDLTRSREDATRFILHLMDGFGVSPSSLRVFFSGNKGFHIEVPAVLFGGFKPSPDLPILVKGIATRLLEGFQTGTQYTRGQGRTC